IFSASAHVAPCRSNAITGVSAARKRTGSFKQPTPGITTAARAGTPTSPVRMSPPIEEVRFAPDSPLEEDGFELVVPDFRAMFFRCFRAENWLGATPGFDDR